MTKQSNLIKLTSLTAFIIAPGTGMGNTPVCANGASYTVPGTHHCRMIHPKIISLEAWGAGGGTDGGTEASAGAGGGSLCEATVTVAPGTLLTITVGAGGMGGMGMDAATKGGTSSVTGSGISGVVADGGSPPDGSIGGKGGTTGACTATGSASSPGGAGGSSSPEGAGGGGGGSGATSPPEISSASAFPGGDGGDGYEDLGGGGRRRGLWRLRWRYRKCRISRRTR